MLGVPWRRAADVPPQVGRSLNFSAALATMPFSESVMAIPLLARCESPVYSFAQVLCTFQVCGRVILNIGLPLSALSGK